MPPAKRSSTRSSTAKKPAAKQSTRSTTATKPAAKKSARTTSTRSTATKKPARSPAPPASRQDSLRAQLQRLLNPLDAMVLTRERVQEALDEAVSRGRMTRADATELLSDLMRRGRRQTDDLLAELEGLLGGTRRAAAAPAERVLREMDRARRATGLGPSFPILGYDDLTAAQVSDRLRDLSPPELRKVRDYERRNANRKSVLAAIEQRLK
jgi:polyhydroxyalkanoate synthesis regulator phasin